MRNGINGNKTARDVAREIHRQRQQQRAAKLAQRMLATMADDGDGYMTSVWDTLDSRAMFGTPDNGPDADE